MEVLLFDLNGTLVCSKGRHQWQLRPGVLDLVQLQNAGVRIGIFTNKTRKNIPLFLFESIGLFFDVILDQEDCEALPSCRSINDFTRQKSLRRHFPEETEAKTIRLIDDDPMKCLVGEEHLFHQCPKWNGCPKDVWLQTFITLSFPGIAHVEQEV
jgi:hypothetical protein